MGKDRVKGAIDELVGSAKQKVGAMIGDSQLQVDGIVQQAKGNLENAWEQAKDAARETDDKPSA